MSEFSSRQLDEQTEWLDASELASSLDAPELIELALYGEATADHVLKISQIAWVQENIAKALADKDAEKAYSTAWFVTLHILRGETLDDSFRQKHTWINGIILDPGFDLYLSAEDKRRVLDSLD